METVIRVRKLNKSLEPEIRIPEITVSGKDAGKHGIELATEMSGLVDPVSEAYTRAPGGRPGTRLVSTRFAERNVVFRVTILGDSVEWFENEELWRSLWSYDSYTEIEVETAKTKRVLRVRLDEYEVDTNYDPAVMGAVDVNMSVVADDPFWYEKADLGKKTRIEVGKKREFDVLRNHGPLYPRIEIVGPATGDILVYVDGQETLISLPSLLSGRYYINTDPGSRQWKSYSDPNVWNRLNGVRYSPHIVPGEYETIIAVENKTNKEIFALVEVPYMRPW